MHAIRPSIIKIMWGYNVFRFFRAAVCLSTSCMTSFFQCGELLAADASGVPADEVRGDEDEHRAYGRGQKQLIRVEIAAA